MYLSEKEKRIKTKSLQCENKMLRVAIFTERTNCNNGRTDIAIGRGHLVRQKTKMKLTFGCHFRWRKHPRCIAKSMQYIM